MRTPLELDFSSIRLSEQIVDIFGHDIDDVFFQRFSFGDGNALTHRLDGPLGIATTLLGDAFAE